MARHPPTRELERDARGHSETWPNFQTWTRLGEVWCPLTPCFQRVTVALWLVYGSLVVARLTGLLHSTMTSAKRRTLFSNL